ncbi:MAG: 3-deoxy-D-manno-octulosonic acid transferase [Verrucomicrobia bacterium]|nr:3-deoxy-D-manno-octulosonic acid transferase [Verrucomicrobiota bacterium]
MLWLYRLFFIPALLVIAPRYLLRMWKRGGYRTGFLQRFGGHPVLPAKTPATRRVWLQAVSVGEVLAITPVVGALHRAGVEVYLTTTTSTAHRLARERLGPLTVGIGYFPLDWWPFSSRTWRRLNPDLAIITEGERWPEHLRQAAQRGIPVLSINARLGDRSFALLRRLPAAVRLVLEGVTRHLPASALDESRLLALGVPPQRVTTTGNLKLDVEIPPLTPAERAQLRGELGLPDGPVLLGSSTWPGEEAALLAAVQQIRRAGTCCALLLVPRHAERRGELERWLATTGESFHFRSRGSAPGRVAIAVADTTGELRRLTQLADIVFVGKSLAPHTEGQTPVEAAALGKAILFGSGMSNFRTIARELVGRGAARQIDDPGAMSATVRELLEDAAARARLAAAAGAWHRGNAGATARTLDVIREILAR